MAPASSTASSLVTIEWTMVMTAAVVVVVGMAPVPVPLPVPLPTPVPILVPAVVAGRVICRWGGSNVAARARSRDNAEGLGLGPGLGPEREVKRWPAGIPGLAGPCPLAFPLPWRRA